LDSHDTARALAIMGGDKSALRLAVLLQMTMPGAPCVYYGDEIGMSSWGDPYCRAAFPWHQESMWNQGLLQFYRQAIAMRHQYPVLRVGSFKTLYAAGDVYAFYRKPEQQEALVVLNGGTTQASCQINVTDVTAREFVQAWPHNKGRVYKTVGDRLEIVLPARDALVLISKGEGKGNIA
jgi:neopullulanase